MSGLLPLFIRKVRGTDFPEHDEEDEEEDTTLNSEGKETFKSESKKSTEGNKTGREIVAVTSQELINNNAKDNTPDIIRSIKAINLSYFQNLHDKDIARTAEALIKQFNGLVEAHYENRDCLRYSYSAKVRDLVTISGILNILSLDRIELLKTAILEMESQSSLIRLKDSMRKLQDEVNQKNYTQLEDLIKLIEEAKLHIAIDIMNNAKTILLTSVDMIKEGERKILKNDINSSLEFISSLEKYYYGYDQGYRIESEMRLGDCEKLKDKIKGIRDNNDLGIDLAFLDRIDERIVSIEQETNDIMKRIEQEKSPLYKNRHWS